MAHEIVAASFLRSIIFNPCFLNCRCYRLHSFSLHMLSVAPSFKQDALSIIILICKIMGLFIICNIFFLLRFDGLVVSKSDVEESEPYGE